MEEAAYTDAWRSKVRGVFRDKSMYSQAHVQGGKGRGCHVGVAVRGKACEQAREDDDVAGTCAALVLSTMVHV